MTLRKKFGRDVKRWFAELRDDVLSAVQRWSFGIATFNAGEVSALEQFKAWLKARSKPERLMRLEKVRERVAQGYSKGVARAFDDVRPEATAGDANVRAGAKSQHLRIATGRQEARDRAELMVHRFLTEVEGATDAMTSKAVAALTDTIEHRQLPADAAGAIKREVDAAAAKASSAAHEAVVRAHADGQLQGLKDLGVESVGVAVEWNTADDGRVCKLCKPLGTAVLKLDEARGMLPRHRGCRCAWIPANVGEDSPQKRTTKAVKRAVAKSRAAGGDGWAPAIPIHGARPSGNASRKPGRQLATRNMARQTLHCRANVDASTGCTCG